MRAYRHRFRPVSGQVETANAVDAPRAALCYRGAMPATPAWPPASTPRLYIDQPLGPDAAPHIDGAAAHYLLNVMRLRVGDPLLLFDNRSGEWLGRIADAGRRTLDLSKLQVLPISGAFTSSPLRL